MKKGRHDFQRLGNRKRLVGVFGDTFDQSLLLLLAIPALRDRGDMGGNSKEFEHLGLKEMWGALFPNDLARLSALVSLDHTSLFDLGPLTKYVWPTPSVRDIVMG